MTPELLERIRHLEIVVERRIEGLLQGEHRALLPGAGRESGDARPYAPGDDVRRIDWNVTARAQRPYVRETIADRELDTTVVMDCSASMSFGTARSEKRELAVAAAAVYGFLTAGAGNRVGAAFATPDGLDWVEPRSGRSHVYRLLAELDRSFAASGGVDLAAALRRVAATRRRRGLVVVIGDFLDEGPWDRSLRSLTSRNEVVAVAVRDPREVGIPDVGVLRLEDPETGRQAWVDTSDRRLRERFAAAAAARADAVRDRLRHAGAEQVVLTTDGDWVSELVRSVLSRRRRAATAGRSA